MCPLICYWIDYWYVRRPDAISRSAVALREVPAQPRTAIMKTLQNLVCLLALALLPACRSDVLLSEQRSFPKKPKFTILPKNYDASSGLDFNAVYYRLVPTQTYYFYRFWPDGRVSKKYVMGRLPTQSDAEDFTHAYVGYYQIEGRQIETELFIPDPTAWIAWDYNRRYGVITGSNIIFSREEMRGETLEQEDVFQKIPLGELKRQPDW